MFGCNSAIKNVDYYNACLNDPECSEELKLVGTLASSSIAYTVDPQTQPSQTAQTIGAICASILTFGLGVLRGKKLKKV